MGKRFQNVITGEELIDEFGTNQIIPANVVNPTQELVKVEDDGSKSALHRYRELQVDPSERFKKVSIITLGEA